MSDDSELENEASEAVEEPTMIQADDQIDQRDELPEFGSLGGGAEPTPTGAQFDPDLHMILDIPVTLSMEVGNTQIPIRDLLQLGQGSVIELDRLAGEPLDVLVNGTLIAHGEVVVINDKFGIRMTDVISPSERIKKLG